MDPLTSLAALSLAIWLYLVLSRGRFWRADQRLAEPRESPEAWPEVVAVVPARDEAAVIGPTVASLLDQDYPGPLSLIVVDDRSRDETAEAARAVALSRAAANRLVVVPGRRLPHGWVGKTWAMAQGVERAAARSPDAPYLWFTDADIAHAPNKLRRLVAKAEADRLDLVSLMAKLHCRSGWERLLIPAFVFFFQKLYPFPLVNARGSRQAGAAGGCMLVRRAALERAGGIAAIRGALIDDCALARLIKAQGPIWVGLAETTVSHRPYDGLGEIWRMVARTAFTQLGHSFAAVALTVAGMAVVYLVPPFAVVAGALAGSWTAAALGAAAWALMALAYGPTLALYGEPARRGLLLPLAALLYTGMTVDSARRHHRGAGGGWKGRVYANAPNESHS